MPCHGLASHAIAFRMSQARTAVRNVDANGSVRLSVEDAARLRILIGRHGEAGAIRMLGLSRSTATRAVACLPLRIATEALIVARLDELERSTRVPELGRDQQHDLRAAGHR
jgi:hypothetical protein